MILTFNLGRDITLITLYPFVFGALLVWWIERHRSSSPLQPIQRVVAKAPRRRLMAGQNICAPGFTAAPIGSDQDNLDKAGLRSK